MNSVFNTNNAKKSSSSMRDYALPLTSPHIKKHQRRALFRSVAFIAVISVYSVFHFTDLSSIVKLPSFEKKVSTTYNNYESIHGQMHRRLQENNETNATVAVESPPLNATDEIIIPEATCGADPKWMLVFYIIGVLYMFIALAVVVDEFFVPALEEMSSERHMDLSMDIAGATLMAAGGSAPELFTAIFGTFKESDVGFGTIVGSAVFNVLFVIAMCSLLSKEVLSLTWWPLFRDSIYYVISLIMLAVFVGVSSPEKIYWYEALVLFCMYIGYVLVMKYNNQIYYLITKKNLKEELNAEKQPESAILTTPSGDDNMDGSIRIKPKDFRNFLWPGTFRAGVLKLLRDPHCWVETGGVGIVSKIAGNVDTTFQHMDRDKDGFLGRLEMKELFEHLECSISDEELDNVIKELDKDEDGMVSSTLTSVFVSMYLFSYNFRLH